MQWQSPKTSRRLFLPISTHSSSHASPNMWPVPFLISPIRPLILVGFDLISRVFLPSNIRLIHGSSIINALSYILMPDNHRINADGLAVCVVSTSSLATLVMRSVIYSNWYPSKVAPFLHSTTVKKYPDRRISAIPPLDAQTWFAHSIRDGSTAQADNNKIKQIARTGASLLIFFMPISPVFKCCYPRATAYFCVICQSRPTALPMHRQCLGNCLHFSRPAMAPL